MLYLLRGPSRARLDAVRSTLNAGRQLVRTRFTNATAERSVYGQTTPIAADPKQSAGPGATATPGAIYALLTHTSSWAAAFRCQVRPCRDQAYSHNADRSSSTRSGIA